MMKSIEYPDWVDQQRPLIIAGPCSAESEVQLMTTAKQLKEGGQVQAFRAGAWKPRTRPGSFEGIGEKALDWMLAVKQEYGFPIAVEVAHPQHVDLCLKKGIDIMWLGARTVVNPFSVEEIAQSLKGCEQTIMVKNPINPDVNLWIGALERIQNANIKNVMAIHRGFFLYEKSPFRNHPMWEIPIELKRRMPGMPIICDPSHIGGNRDLLFEISQKAMDLVMDGLMVETHFDPDNALSDVEQQITPRRLDDIISQLRIPACGNIPAQANAMTELRERIDDIDRQILQLLSNRMDVVQQLSAFKKQQNLSVLQLDRWREIVNDRLELSDQLSLDKSFVLRLLQLVHKESIRIQTKSNAND